MKARNIVQIATLVIFATTASTQCMFMNGLKALIRGTGTAIGVGLPTVPFMAFWGGLTYKQYSDPVAALGETRTPSEDEENFLRQFVKNKDIVLRISDDPGTSGTILDKTIRIENTSLVSNLTLRDVINSNDPTALEVRKTFAAIAEHEAKHAEQNDSLKRQSTLAFIPCVTTGVATTAAKKIFPLNKQSSLLKHCLRFGAKTVGGSALALANLGINLYAMKLMAHYQEHRADQNISPENRIGLIKHLRAAEKINNDAMSQIQNEQEKTIFSAVIDTLHPSTEERIKRLQNGTKNS